MYTCTNNYTCKHKYIAYIYAHMHKFKPLTPETRCHVGLDEYLMPIFNQRQMQGSEEKYK